MRLLIVEDDIAVAGSLGRALELFLEDAHIDIVGSVKDTLELTHARDFDFILLDLIMAPSPSMTPKQAEDGLVSGMAMLRELMACNSTTPIGILTATRGPYLEEVHAECDTHPQVRFVRQKPYPVKELAREIELALRGSAGEPGGQ